MEPKFRRLQNSLKPSLVHHPTTTTGTSHMILLHTAGKPSPFGHNTNLKIQASRFCILTVDVMMHQHHLSAEEKTQSNSDPTRLTTTADTHHTCIAFCIVAVRKRFRLPSCGYHAISSATLQMIVPSLRISTRTRLDSRKSTTEVCHEWGPFPYR